MQINSINTNLAAYSAQRNIGIASNLTASSVSRLSSGNRITQASDDVAALSIGTSLKTNVSTLRTALLNTSQGSALLQVADGALAQVSEILQRQKAIAVQAGSGTLGETERAFLDAEFQELSSEIDRIAGSTNFNGVKLIDGALSRAADVSSTSTQASKASTAISFSQTILAGESVVIGGVVLVAGTANSGTTFEVGGTLSETVNNLAARLTALRTDSSYVNTIGQASYTSSGNTLTITANAGGSLSNNFAVKTAQQSTLAATAFSTTNASTSVVVTVASGHGFVAGQLIRVSGEASTIGGVSMSQEFTVASVTSTTVTLTSSAAATSTATGGSAGSKLNANLANTQIIEADNNGGFAGSSFTVFATGFASATSAISATTGAPTTPFQNGDSITAQVAGGTAKTLATLTTGAGTANSSGDYSLTDIVNLINANTGTSGYKAALTYNGSTYNIRLSYDTLQSNVILSLGTNTNYDSTTYGLNGATISSANIIDGDAAADRNRAIFNTGVVDLLASDIGAVAANATVIGTSATAPFVVGDSILATVNGTTHLLHTFVANDGFDDIIASINAKTALTGIYAAIDGTSANVDNVSLFFSEPGAAGSQIALTYSGTVGDSAGAVNTATKVTTTAATISQTSTYGLAGGADNGLGKGSTSVTGDTNGDSILTDLAQVKANVSVLLTQNAVANDTITVGGQAFYFGASASTPNQILIGADLQETLDNAVKTINNYLADGYAIGDTAYQLNQLTVKRDGNSLVFQSKGLADVTKLDGTTASIAQSITGASITNSGNLDNASETYGVDVTGVTNSAFIGTISGFTATYTGTADTADLSVTVGEFTYTAEDVDLTTSSDTRVRFYSNTVDGKSGGFFDIQLDNGQVSTFSSQSDANTIATRLDAAFSNLTFRQNRILSSYIGGGAIIAGTENVGSLVGTKVTAQLGDFTDLKITDISVTAPSGSTTDAKITITVNGVEYSTGNALGDTLGANQTYRLTSANNPNEFFEFTTGDTAINISAAENATAIENALEVAFSINEDSAALSFQVGTTSDDSLLVSIGDSSTEELFAGVELNVLTSAAAAIAVNALDVAIQSVTRIRANVGAIQSRFNFASANIESAIQNQDAARGTLLDTDIAAESTVYATAQVKLQAGISVLAQANQQIQSLLKLIG